MFVLEATEEVMRHRRPGTDTHRHPGELHEVRVHGPSAPFLPEFTGPSVVYSAGPHWLELLVDEEGSAWPVSDGLIIRA
jgi:hypothetical protein